MTKYKNHIAQDCKCLASMVSKLLLGHSRVETQVESSLAIAGLILDVVYASRPLHLASPESTAQNKRLSTFATMSCGVTFRRATCLPLREHGTAQAQYTQKMCISKTR